MVGVIMDIERYDIEIENEIQKATKYSRILNTAVPYLSGSNWKLGAVERAFEKLKDSKNRQERNNRLASFLKALEDKGVELLYVTLHVGLGTFRPVMEEDITKHNMHSEEYEITEDVAKKLNEAKNEGRKIYAVGTTSTRTLEANITKYGQFTSTKESTNIYIYPGYQFKAIDGLITNFHLPKSTLLMLVSALSSKENILKAYEYAINKKYRFFSFGDAMLIR